MHGMGIVVGRFVETLGTIRIYQGSTIGGDNFKTAEYKEKTLKQPLIMPRVVIGINSTVIGPIVIGKQVIVGVGAIVTQNVEDYSIVVGNNKIINEK